MQPGTRLNGRYTLQRILGEGAQGTTYEAHDEKAGRQVAIKRFDVRGAKSWKDVELAEREARVLATIDHPLVPRYFEHFEEGDSLFLVMEKIEGETLESVRARRGALPEEEVRRFLTCADRALSYLHGRSSPVVHRDIKPRNVVRRADGSFVFVDFGTVSELVARRSASTVVGTVGYMAPEQMQGRAMPATDIYAVGATALAALTGEDPDKLAHRGLAIDVRRALAGRASEAMIATLERMLEPDPDKRPRSVADAIEWGREERAVARDAKLSRSAEDGAVKSIRSLLWVLWGLGWVIVPLLVRKLDLAKDVIPIAMFGSLACLFVVTWHKGAVLRAILRALSGSSAGIGVEEAAARTENVEPQRMRVDVMPDKVRVHAEELDDEELVGRTELPAPNARRARHASR